MFKSKSGLRSTDHCRAWHAREAWQRREGVACVSTPVEARQRREYKVKVKPTRHEVAWRLVILKTSMSVCLNSSQHSFNHSRLLRSYLRESRAQRFSKLCCKKKNYCNAVRPQLLDSTLITQLKCRLRDSLQVKFEVTNMHNLAFLHPAYKGLRKISTSDRNRAYTLARSYIDMITNLDTWQFPSLHLLRAHWQVLLLAQGEY